METKGWERAKRWIDLIAGVSVVLTMGFIALQWNEMRSGSVDTHDLAVAAKTQADAAKSQADNTKIVAESAKSQAQAAVNAANIANGSLDLSRQAFHVTERPYVTIESMRFDPALQESHLPAILKYDFHNAGKTPALNARQEPHAFIDGKATAEQPRDFPGEMTIASDRNVGASMSIWVSGGDFEGIRDGTRRLSLKGRITYSDIFKERHTTIFCAEYDAKVTKTWVYCPGNDVK